MAAPSPEPFRLAVPEEVLSDLRARLERTRWPDEIAGSDWRYGSNLAYVQALRNYWTAYYHLRRVTLYDFVTKQEMADVP